MSFIQLSIQHNIATIILNRPEKFNAFNREMSLELQQVLNEVEQNETVRCIYFTGVGKAFCSGQDLSEVTQPNPPSIETIVKEHYNPIILKLRNINLPVVCAVNGIAAGAGANIALAADIVVATESAAFVQAFSKIGLIPDCGGTYILPRLIGLQKAIALMFMADKIMAKEAVEMGMIYKSFTDDVFAEESYKIAQHLAQMPTKGLVLTKQLLNLSFSNTLEQQLAHEDKTQQQAAATKDFKEGVSAFLEKRLPIFVGK